MSQAEIVAWMRANPGPHTAFDIAEGLGYQDPKNVMTGMTRLRKWGDVVVVGTARHGSGRRSTYLYMLKEAQR